ncbi:23S rRNA (pseudouridine(1915)-N(3))-methyltransferase RlmH [Crocosphaera sp. Alani8]|uniref:23S rRNA (pseudouridine(1915)-N(3))-methyltransferase RlmH n=1 Tax=Crocosphaera sp. Alani8 TaxID=3038952 RepID=UPI00313C3F7A
MINFAKIRLIVVGKIKKTWIREGINIYLKRLPKLVIQEIKDSTPIKEGEQILSMLKSRDYLIILTEEGQQYTTIDFTNFLNQINSHNVVFVIGGAEGISQKLKQQASLQLSLSPMTFPHEVARLLLIEQLYRAKTILQGSNYHKF